MASIKPIGEFKQRVTFRNPTKTPDGAGGQTESYTDLLTTWAMVNFSSGSRYWNIGQDEVLEKGDIYVFYRSALSTGLKKDTVIMYNGKMYSIDHQHIVDEVKKIIKFEVTGSI